MEGQMAELSAMKSDLQRIQEHCRILSDAHRARGIRELSQNRTLSVLVTILTVLIGPSSIAVMTHVGAGNLLIANILNGLTGGMSVVAAILSGTQTVLNPAQQSIDDKDAADNYSTLKDKIDIWDAQYTDPKQEDEAFIEYERHTEDFGQITRQAPPIKVLLP
jgi:hypothetical protein